MSRLSLLCVEYTDFEGFPIGGQKTFIKNMVRILDCNCLLVGLGDAGDTVGRWTVKTIQAKQYPFLPICLKNKAPKNVPVRLWFLYCLIRFRKAIFSRPADAVFIQSPEAFFPFMLGSYRQKCIFRMAGANNPLKKAKYTFARHPLFQCLYDRLFVFPLITQAAMIVSINDECLSLVRKVGKRHLKKVVKASVAVDIDIFHPVADKRSQRAVLGLPSDGTIITFAGRLEAVKGLTLLLDAFALLKSESWQPLCLVLVGDGTQRQMLEARCLDLNITESVLFTGSVLHDKLKDYLSASDLFALTSLHEGLPNAILEAMASGLPVVATNVGGVNRVVKDFETGFLVDTREPEEFAKLMAKALELQKEMAVNTRRLIEQGYSVHAVADKIQIGFMENGFYDG